MSNPGPSCLYSGNAGFIEELYEDYLQNPGNVDAQWRDYFASLQSADGPNRDVPHSPVRRAIYDAVNKKSGRKPATALAETISYAKQVAVLQLINAYRFRGHHQADLDPLRLYGRPEVPELDPAYHNLSEADMDTLFNSGSLFAPAELPLRDILGQISSTYCRTIGAEYMHINETEQKRWIQQRLEECQARPSFSDAKRKHILERVIAANGLEEYLHTKYVGQKRFSLEGGESLIPLLDELVQDSCTAGAREIVIGMAHRGRLNVLVNIMGKFPHELFGEFEGRGNDALSMGDVKYHMGYSSDIDTDSGSVHLTLGFNPSHLEIIDPVVEGSVRARQDRRNDKTRDQVLPILIHGDAAFAGQGVVMETFNLSQTRGYTTGGTVHVIVNNQIGFTTSDPLDSRSSLYCTDVAKMVQAPIFHVNGDDPEAVVFTAKLALEYRFAFKKDVIVDMICYRRHGHSEADEPAATQPLMYKKIRQHPTVDDIYARRLIDEEVLNQADVEGMAETYIEYLDDNKTAAGKLSDHIDTKYMIDYTPYRGTSWLAPVTTAIDDGQITRFAQRITDIPEGFILHPSVGRIIENRRRMGTGDLPMDWGFAENMAYAALVDEGHPIRISGQDSGRGTFFHRHAVLHNQDNGDTYLPLQHVSEGQASFLAINSTLSEEAVLGFEYGYSSAAPATLVIWEAQFGDFANGAQVVFDQFISSCEAKWGRYCGLTVLLPHGYDGQGPEHSSARLERYLQLCAQENMQVCYPSTPAQMFHLLRRQVLRPYRKPLIVMSPKSLLRHKLSTSPVTELKGEYQLVIDEIDEINKAEVTRLLVCSGKVYYDLLESRRINKLANIAIIRLEQLFPFPMARMKEVLEGYPNASEVIWVQEEPKNQGSWYYMQSRGTMIGCLSDQHAFGYAGRFYSASPAVGYMSKHLQQQKDLVSDALQLDKIEVTHRHRKTA